MQQHSYPSHSRHFVFPAPPAEPGLTIELIVLAAAEPGWLEFVRVVGVEEHIFGLFFISCLEGGFCLWEA